MGSKALFVWCEECGAGLHALCERSDGWPWPLVAIGPHRSPRERCLCHDLDHPGWPDGESAETP